MRDNRSPIFRTPSGGWFDPHHPERFKFNLEDIVVPLSRICRFAGNLDSFYSVAQHSVLVSQYLWDLTSDHTIALQGLMHDSTECLIGDIPTPIKRLAPNISLLEKEILAIIYDAIDLPYPNAPEVKAADVLMFWAEVRDMSDWPETARAAREAHDIPTIYPWSAEKSADLFRKEYIRHTQEIQNDIKSETDATEGGRSEGAIKQAPKYYLAPDGSSWGEEENREED